MTIRIVTPGPDGHGTRAFNEDGTEIKGLLSVDLTIRPDQLVEARVEILTHGVDVKAHPLLGFQTVKAAAEAYGFRLVPVEE